MSRRLRNIVVAPAVLFLLCGFSMPVQAAEGEQPLPEGVEIIIDALQGSDESMHAVAIALARDIPGTEVTKALVKELPNLPVTGQVQLLSALADRGDKAALSAVTQAAKAKEQSVREAALKALGQLGDASSVELLAKSAATTTGAERKAARASLYRLRGEEVDQAILAAIPDAEPEVKVELISSVGERNIAAGGPVLLKTAKDPDGRVQRESYKVLKLVAGRKDVPVLVELLTGLKIESVRSEAERTVAAVARRIEDESEQVEAVLAALPDVTDSKSRSSLLSVLGKIGSDSALPVLRSALKDKDPAVQEAAIRALSQWPNAGPINDLYEAANSSENTLHRILAFRGYVRLIGLESSRSAEETLELYKKAMDSAPNANEKKRVLAGVANVHSSAALKTAEGFLRDAALRQEAEVAIIKIAAAICDSYPQLCRNVLGRIVRTSKAEALRRQAQEVLDRIENAGWHQGR